MTPLRMYAEVPAPMRHGGAFEQLRRPEIANDEHRHSQQDRRRERHKAERLAKRREREGDRKRQSAQRRGHENAMRPALPEWFAAANEEDDQDLRRHGFDEPRGMKRFRGRMKAVQQDPGLIRFFKDELGLLLQGNLQCFGDPVGWPTRTLAEKFIAAGEYFVLGTDLHNPQSMDVRMNGLKRAIEVVGEEEVNKLTITHPYEILKTVL